MDMMMNCRGHTNEWQTTTVKEITLSDGSTYTMQYRNPVNDNTRHTFAYENTTIDSDGKIFKKGDLITYGPNTKHSSHTKKGCLILTFMRGQNKITKK